MTPQETADYKMRWLRNGAHAVRAHSDLHIECKDWCRRNIERHQWSFDKYTASYEHTFWFENQADADRFTEALKSIWEQS